MPITLRPDLRQVLQRAIDRRIDIHTRDHQRSTDSPPWPGPTAAAEASRPERELMVVPTDPVSMQVMVKSSLLYQQGLFRQPWPRDTQGELVRTSPVFNAIVDGDYRIDLLYLSHAEVLKIQAGTAASPYSEEGALVDEAAVPTHPDRGVPLAYIILLPGLTAITSDSILDIRPYVTSVASEDVDTSFDVFQDFSSQVDGARTLFEFDLPVEGDQAIVRMNGIIQQPGTAYAISGGSLALTFTPLAGEVLTVEHELGDKGNYSGYGLCPWGTGLFGV